MCHEAIIGLYERHACDFDRDRGRTLQEKAWLDRFLSDVRQPRTVLDIGCGMAEPIAQYLIEAGCHEQLLTSNGFSLRAHVDDDPECGEHTVWLASTAPLCDWQPTDTSRSLVPRGTVLFTTPLSFLQQRLLTERDNSSQIRTIQPHQQIVEWPR